MRQQVHVYRIAVVHVANGKQGQFRIRIFTRHLVAIVARRLKHHILAYQHTGVNLEFALVIQNFTVKAVTRLRQRASIFHFAHKHFRTAQERPLLRHARNFIKRDGYFLGV